MKYWLLRFIKLASKLLLCLEAYALGWWSLFGMWAITEDLHPLFTGLLASERIIKAIIAVMTICFLVSGWRVFFWVFLNGPKKGKKIHVLWLLFSVVGVLVSTVYFFWGEAQIFRLGILFVPTAMHLAIEILWQKHTNTQQQHQKK